MITFSTDEAHRILSIVADGKISEADIDGAMDELQSRYPEVGVRIAGGSRGGVAILLDWERLEGWELGAKTLGTLTGKMLSDAVNRVAVVADEKWRGEEDRLADVAKRATVRFFPPARREEALAWLRGK